MHTTAGYIGKYHFISFSEINTRETDIVDDVWDFPALFPDVFEILDRTEPATPDFLTEKLLKKVKSFLND